MLLFAFSLLCLELHSFFVQASLYIRMTVSKHDDYIKSNILKCAGVSSGANGASISSMADSRI